jgi:hypothetical protein
LAASAKAGLTVSSAVEPVPSSGLVLGRYRPLRPLGSGGSGSVWLCRDESAGIEVALKIIPREGRAEPRAEREAEAATRLRHPNCLRAYGLEADDGHLYIPYEYVPGITLRQALRAGLGDDGAVESAAQVLDGLAFAHARGIVHRDVKPSNVLVAEDADVSVRLFDFGLAQLADADTLTAVGDVPGTLAYISPERLHGEQAGPPADVWAVGVLLWEALAGHHPFWRESPLETGEEIKTGAPSIREARPDLPDRVVTAVDAALEVEPDARPSAAGLARELRDAWWERSPGRARSRRPRLRFAPRAAGRRVVPPALAALSAGWIATALPFYPELWPLLLAAVAAVLTLLRPRLGLAFTLAVPVFPLGNVSFGLAVAYALVAAGWLALMWGDARRGLLCSVGLVLGPVGLLGLAPLAALGARGVVRRASHAAAAVLLAGAAAGIRGTEIPFTGRPAPELDIAGSEHPIAVLQAVWQWLEAAPALGLEALILGLAAGSLALVARGTDLTIASFAGCLLAGTLLVAPHVPAFPLVVTGWVTYVALSVLSRRLPARTGKRRTFGALLTQTCAQFADRLKAGGGMRRPPRRSRSSTRFRHAGAR